jgi:hypothetical protein
MTGEDAQADVDLYIDTIGLYCVSLRILAGRSVACQSTQCAPLSFVNCH